MLLFFAPSFVSQTQSCSVLKRKNNVIHDVCSLRCSTAPSYGTVRQFLKDKIFHSAESEEDSVFEESPASNKLINVNGRRSRLETFPSINPVQNSAHHPKSVTPHIPPNKNETGMYTTSIC